MVGNLSFDTNEQSLSAALGFCGQITDVKVSAGRKEKINSRVLSEPQPFTRVIRSPPVLQLAPDERPASVIARVNAPDAARCHVTHARDAIPFLFRSHAPFHLSFLRLFPLLSQRPNLFPRTPKYDMILI